MDGISAICSPGGVTCSRVKLQKIKLKFAACVTEAMTPSVTAFATSLSCLPNWLQPQTGPVSKTNERTPEFTQVPTPLSNPPRSQCNLPLFLYFGNESLKRKSQPGPHPDQTPTIPNPRDPLHSAEPESKSESPYRVDEERHVGGGTVAAVAVEVEPDLVGDAPLETDARLHHREAGTCRETGLRTAGEAENVKMYTLNAITCVHTQGWCQGQDGLWFAQSCT